jgi:acyl-CoA reductase-like NAD-dependent aldehyde dehydrogenase
LSLGHNWRNRAGLRTGESIDRFHGGWKENGIGGGDREYGVEHYLQKKTVNLRFEA